MPNYVFFTDSTCDISAELEQEMDAVVLPITFTIEGKNYHDYPDNREMDPHDFYDKLRAGSISTTSQINSAAFTAAFEPVLQAGQDVFYLAFSGSLSGTYQSSVLAAEDLQEKYPDRRVVCVDSLQASMGEGLFAYTAAMQRKAGLTLDELADWCHTNAQSFSAWFTVDDLMFLKRGGRLSGSAALAGTLLGIKPVLHVDADGHLMAVEKVRGRKASLDSIIKQFERTATDEAKELVFIANGDCPEDAEYLADAVRALGVKRVCINSVGPVVGAHTGPGVVTLHFRCTER